jgi:hypothetical protein
MLQQKRRALA